VALMCRLIIHSKLFSRNDNRLIGLKFFAVVWVPFPALGMKSLSFLAKTLVVLLPP